MTTGVLEETKIEANPVNPAILAKPAPSADPALTDTGVIKQLDSVAPESTFTPTQVDSTANEPAQTANPELPTYDAITKDVTPEATVQGQLESVLDTDGVLMDIARSAGDEYSASRGMLNSTMAGEASMGAVMDRALPIASQDASAHLSQLQQNQGYENTAAQFNATNAVQQVRDSILQSYQLQMENLSTANKESLINLEQQWAASIQSDINATEAYRSTMDQIGILMSNGDLSIDQQNAGLNELIGMLGSYLEFNSNLSSVNAITGEVTSGASTGVGIDGYLTDMTASRESANEIRSQKDALGTDPQAYADAKINEAILNRVVSADNRTALIDMRNGFIAQWEQLNALYDKQLAEIAGR